MRDSLQRALYYNKHISNHSIYDIRTLNDYSIKDWADKVNLYQRIGDIDQLLLYHKPFLRGNVYDAILSGIDRYLRIYPRLHLNSLMLIKDDIYEVAKYFLMAYNVIKHIIINQSRKNTTKSINFQFDFGIVCNKSVQKKGSCFPQFWSNKNCAPNEVLYPGYDQNIKDGIKWTCKELPDCIADIHNRLTSNNNTFIMKKMNINRFPRCIQTLQKIDNLEMNLLINLCRKYMIYSCRKQKNIVNVSSFKYRKGIYNSKFSVHSKSYESSCDEMDKLSMLSLENVMEKICPEMNIDRVIFEILDFMCSHEANKELLCNFITKNNDDAFTENQQTMLNMYDQFASKINAINFPHGYRFCGIVDRRDEKDYKYRQSAAAKPQYADTMYFFQPKENQMFPENEDILAEYYFDSSQTSFLPKFNPHGHTRNYNTKAYKDRYYEYQRKKICSHSLCNGKLLMLTFIVESTDVIKCYLFRDSTFIRFFGRDIIDILPKLFIAGFANNSKFGQGDDVAERIANGMSFYDTNFQYWYTNLV